MDSLVKEWKRRHEEIFQFEDPKHVYYNNVLRAATAIEEFKVFVDTSVPMIEAWLHSYLTVNRQELYLKFWLRHGCECIDHYLDRRCLPDSYPEFSEQWILPDILQTEKGAVSTSFQEATGAVAEYHRRKNIDQCDVPKILEIHKDKKCESNGWFCWTCEDVEFTWDRHLKDKLSASNNIFLNKKLHPVFLETALPFPPNWTPPEKHFDENRGSYGTAKSTVYTTEERMEESVRNRQEYQKDGKTPMQCMKEVMHHVKYKKEWRLDYGMKTEFEFFVCFWGTLPMIQHAINLDVKRCQEIRAIL